MTTLGSWKFTEILRTFLKSWTCLRTWNVGGGMGNIFNWISKEWLMSAGMSHIHFLLYIFIRDKSIGHCSQPPRASQLLGAGTSLCTQILESSGFLSGPLPHDLIPLLSLQATSLHFLLLHHWTNSKLSSALPWPWLKVPCVNTICRMGSVPTNNWYD